MRSDTLLEQRAAVPNAPTVRDLLVLWQHPDTREIVPIGRLSHDASTYSFVYTRGVTSIQDFRSLPGLPDLRREYVSNRLPPVFGQRIMESDRPDYAEYIASLGLDPSRATPWEQIVYSGGARAGDTLQFMQVPTITNLRVCARFLANGIRHIPGPERNVDGRLVRVSAAEHELTLQHLRAGDSLAVLPEIGNPFDANAAVVEKNGLPVGYIPRLLATSVRELLTWGPVAVTVIRVGAPGTPAHLRLVLDLDMAVPPGFELDRQRQWEPLPAQ